MYIYLLNSMGCVEVVTIMVQQINKQNKNTTKVTWFYGVPSWWDKLLPKKKVDEIKSMGFLSLKKLGIQLHEIPLSSFLFEKIDLCNHEMSYSKNIYNWCNLSNTPENLAPVTKEYRKSIHSYQFHFWPCFGLTPK